MEIGLWKVDVINRRKDKSFSWSTQEKTKSKKIEGASQIDYTN